jgi:hypothetical protein
MDIGKQSPLWPACAGALVNMLDDSKQVFARAANLIRARLAAHYGFILRILG